jgi:hypothetical protein
MKRSMLFLAALALVLSGGGQSNTGFIGFEAQTALNVDFPDPSFPGGIRTLNSEGKCYATENDLFQFAPPGLGVVEAGVVNASAANVDDGVLEARAMVASYRLTAATADSSWFESATLSGNGKPPQPFLTLKLAISGILDQSIRLVDESLSQLTIKVNTPGGNFAEGVTELTPTGSRNQFTTQGLTNVVTSPSGQNGEGVSFSAVFAAKVPRQADGSYLSEVEWIALANTDGGFANADGRDPVSLLAVTLPDGNTPESEGYKLTFATGIPSPNIPLITSPEPSGLTLLGIGIVGLLVSVWRRGKEAASAVG